MRSFALVSAAAAPVLLIGGWSVAQDRQPAGFDPLHDTISALAAVDATDRVVMTVALAGVGVAHLVTAAGLGGVPRWGRGLLAFGGLATLLIAAFPLPAVGDSVAHEAVATLAFLALAVWPFFSACGSAGILRRAVTFSAGVVLLALVGWFGAVLALDGPVGLAERVAAGAQAVWPLVVAGGLWVRSRKDHRT